MKLKVGELLRLACLYAEQDRIGFIDCHAHMPDDPAAVEAAEYLEQLRAYRGRRWGKTGLEKYVESATAFNVFDQSEHADLIEKSSESAS